MSFEQSGRFRDSLAFRLTLWYAAVFAIFSAVAFLMFYLFITSVIRERIDQAPPVFSVKELDDACAKLMKKLEVQNSTFSQLRRKVDNLNPNDDLAFKRALKDLVAVVYLGSSKDDFLGMLSKYVGPTWIEFVGHGDGVGLVGGNTPESNRIAQERYSNLLRDLGRAAKAHREALFAIRTELKHRYAK